MDNVFFNRGDMLAQMFTSEKFWDVDRWGKYMPDGRKPIEAFENDIMDNLVQWATDKEGIVFFKTKEFWYIYEAQAIATDHPIIRISRFGLYHWNRLDEWINLGSTSVGKDWLIRQPQLHKRVPLFDKGQESPENKGGNCS